MFILLFTTVTMFDFHVLTLAAQNLRIFEVSLKIYGYHNNSSSYIFSELRYHK